MNTAQVIDITKTAIFATAQISIPLLATALIVGLLVSIFQAATQINEATLSFLPKIAAMMIILLVTAPWMISKMRSFTQEMFNMIPEITRQK